MPRLLHRLQAFFPDRILPLLLSICTAFEPQELLELKEKFEIGMGEARAYHALAKQAQNLAVPAGAATLFFVAIPCRTAPASPHVCVHQLCFFS